MRGSDRDRGQLGFDFLVGMSVFLLSVGFVFGFLPGMFAPFSGNTGTHMIVADRSAASLAEDLLVDDPNRPIALNETCTVEFFDGDGETADCRFDADSDALSAALGVGEAKRINATIESSDAIVTLDGEELAAGPTPPAKTDVTVSRRLVYLDGGDRRLFVRVW